MTRRYRDPTLALERPEPELPLWKRIIRAIVVGILVAGAVYLSVRMG